MLALGQVANVLGQRSPTPAGLEHAGQHPDVHVDRPVRDAGVVARALKVSDRGRGNRRERHVSEMPLDEGQALLLELECPRRATHPLRFKVRLDGFGQPLWSLLVGGYHATTCAFNQVALALLGRLEVRRAEALPVTLSGDGEVCPVLTAAFP